HSRSRAGPPYAAANYSELLIKVSKRDRDIPSARTAAAAAIVGSTSSDCIDSTQLDTDKGSDSSRPFHQISWLPSRTRAAPPASTCSLTGDAFRSPPNHTTLPLHLAAISGACGSS